MSEVAQKEVVIYPANNGDTAKLPLVADIQFLEPFSSEALNRKFLGIVPAGIYRGFGVTITGDNTIQIGDDSGKNTAIVERNGVAITVQGQHPVNFTVPYDRQLAVVIEAIYQHGLITKQVDKSSLVDAASIKLIPLSSRQPYHLTVCEIMLPTGQVLSDGLIDMSSRDGGGVYDTYTREEANNAFVSKANAATDFDIENEQHKNKHVTLPSLWKAIAKKLSELSVFTIKTDGALSGGGKLDKNLTLSVRGASEEQAGVVQLSSSTTGASKVKAATEYVVRELKKLIDGKAATEHSHNASHINAGTLHKDRLPSATQTDKGAVQITASYASSSQTLVPCAKALSDGLSTRAENVYVHSTNGNVQVARRSCRTEVNRDGTGNGVISLDASSFKLNDEIIINNIHPLAGIATITNIDGTIYVPNGEAANSHTLTGQGSVVLVKIAGNDLKVKKVY